MERKRQKSTSTVNPQIRLGRHVMNGDGPRVRNVSLLFSTQKRNNSAPHFVESFQKYSTPLQSNPLQLPSLFIDDTTPFCAQLLISHEKSIFGQAEKGFYTDEYVEHLGYSGGSFQPHRSLPILWSPMWSLLHSGRLFNRVGGIELKFYTFPAYSRHCKKMGLRWTVCRSVSESQAYTTHIAICFLFVLVNS